MIGAIGSLFGRAAGRIGVKGVIIVLIVIGVAGMSAALRVQTLKVDNVEQARDAAVNALAQAEGTIQWQRSQFAATIQALEQRDAALQQVAERIRMQREQLDQLETSDAQTSDWLDQPVPAGVAGWVRDLSQPDSNTGVADSASVPDNTTAGADTNGEQQP
ncbi:hypothetical protein [Kushneria aurantia]|uniref:LysB family phage lysis regulatory protein n=1 Tax=Kushneria aurantia TaxID=504092 RepID=A0ABV6G575_9GAMM|nr:hypothetical protein [Kushneria aurantia]